MPARSTAISDAAVPSYGNMQQPEPRTRVERAVRSIRADIVSGVFPPESKLAVDALRERYGVGSSTIREALSLLIPDGMVVAQGQRGFSVAPISIDDLRDLSDTRVLLETHALRLSIEHGDDEWEAGIVATFHRLGKAQAALDAGLPGSAAEWETRNHQFHDALTAACDSQWIRRILDMLHHHSERYRRRALAANGQTSPARRDVHAEHRAIMEAALERDIDGACACAAEHIVRTTEVLAAVTDQTDGVVQADEADDDTGPLLDQAHDGLTPIRSMSPSQ